MKTLLALGGGYDSTYLLWKLLKDTTDELVCFRIDMRAIKYDDPHAKTKTGREFYEDSAECEAIAVARVLEWMNTNIRPVSCITVPVTESEPGEWTTPNMIRVAGRLAHQHNVDRFVWGRTLESTSPNQGQINLPFYKNVLWVSVAPAGVPMEMPLFDEGKARPHIIAELPADLELLTVPCNKAWVENGSPVRCGHCWKCVFREESKQMLQRGIHPDAILDYFLRKRGAGQYAQSRATDKKYQSGVKGNQIPFLMPAWRK